IFYALINTHSSRNSKNTAISGQKRNISPSPNSATGDANKKADRNYNVGWSAFVSPSFKKLFTAEVFAKGYKNKDDKQQLFFGAYITPTVVSMIKDSAFGGSVYLDDGELEEWNIDLRCVLQLSEKLKTHHTEQTCVQGYADHAYGQYRIWIKLYMQASAVGYGEH
ncbi:MAG: hypothetical protein K2N31_05560, partial [Treponemataceae bacterium]|nr:hypothetical protein [Treponemataceae bacterium]